MEHGNRDKMDEVGDESSNGELCNEKKEQHSHQDTYRVNSGSNSTPPQPVLFLVTKVKYHDILVKIFSDSTLDSNPRQFFFEPLVLLDPKTIFNKLHGFLKQDFICFTVQMWNEKLRAAVMEHLRSLESLNNVSIGEHNVFVMPYEEVELVHKSGSFPQSIRLMDQSTSYLRSKENLDFYLLCDSPSMAEAFTEDFQHNPEFTLNCWQLTLECRGLAVQSSSVEPASCMVLLKRLTNSFAVSVLPNGITSPVDDAQGHRSVIEDERSEQINELQAQIATLMSSKTSNVFGVRNCSNPEATPGESFGFKTTDFPTRSEYGKMDMATGIFTAIKPGIYQFHFDSHIYGNSSDWGKDFIRHFELRVNGIRKALFFTYLNSQRSVFDPVAISALLSLNMDDKVGVFLEQGRLCEDDAMYTSRFSCVFVSD